MPTRQGNKHQGYFCVGQTAGNQDVRGKILLGGETATWIYIKFNDLSQLISPLGDEFRVADGAERHSYNSGATPPDTVRLTAGHKYEVSVPGGRKALP